MSSPHELSADDVIFVEEEPALGMESRDLGLGQGPATNKLCVLLESLTRPHIPHVGGG